MYGSVTVKVNEAEGIPLSKYEDDHPVDFVSWKVKVGNETKVTAAPKMPYSLVGDGLYTVDEFPDTFKFDVQSLSETVVISLVYEGDENAVLGQAAIKVSTLAQKKSIDEFLNLTSGGLLKVAASIALTQAEGASTAAAIDTSSPFETVQAQVKMIEQLKKTVSQLPPGRTKEEARAKLQLETEALKQAEEFHKLTNPNLFAGAKPAKQNIFQQIKSKLTGEQPVSSFMEMFGTKKAEEGAKQEGPDVLLIVKGVLIVGTFLLAGFIFRPTEHKSKMSQSKSCIRVKRGDPLTRYIPSEYCDPSGNFYPLNPEVCERAYALPGETVYIPKTLYDDDVE